MKLTLTHFKAALIGCSLAAASCLAPPNLRSHVPTQCSFQLAETVGEWVLLDRESLPESELRILRASDHWRCSYQNQRTKQIVVATLVAGDSGPLASHLPATCYARNEFVLHNAATMWTLPNPEGNFRFQTLQPRTVDQPAVTIAYAWHDGNQWRAPQYPRMQLAGCGTLQRLMVTMRHPIGASGTRKAIQDFLALAVNSDDLTPTLLVQN